jgi:ATP-dependent helicase/nuclease subunit A
MNPTTEQLTAIQTIDRALLVEAGAGTGKTWVLVQRFLHLLAQHPDWPLEGIIAITYTEKAAREMRTRVRQALEERAAEHPDDPVWQAHRRDLDQLQVSTIHGLCARILRENAIAAGLDPRFEVLDQNQSDLLKGEAIESTLANLAQPSKDHALVPGSETALELLATLNVRDVREQMARLLLKRGTVERLFAELPAAPTLIERWQAGTADMRATLWQEQLSDPDFRAALAELDQIVIRDPDDKLAAGIAFARQGHDLAALGQLAEACQAWAQINLVGGKGAAWGGAEIMKEIKDDLKLLREAAKAWINSGYLNPVGEADQQAALALQQWKVVWLAVAGTYQQMKSERFALDFDDLELMAGGLLKQEPRPERLQAYLDGICHLMVDEFQDTNLAQKDIIYALAHPAAGGRLFVVGDAKQSIYRFRQAQVAVFNQTARDIHTLTGFPPVPLSGSFRTHAQLLSALNSLFASVLQPLAGQHADFEARPGALQPQRPAHSERACVELYLLPNKTEDEQTLHAEEARIFEARLLAQRLLQLQAEDYPVWDRDHYRPFRFDDAAILFRSTTNLPLYEEQFKAAGLPYLTVSGRGYFDRPEIRDLLALLSSIYNPADDLNLAAALRSPLFNLSDETLYQLRWHTPTPAGRSPDPQGWVKGEQAIGYLSALHNPPPCDQADALRFAAAVIDELLAMAGRAPVWQLLRTALDRTGFEAFLTLSDQEQRNGGRQRSNIIKFMNLARQDGGASLSGFLLGLANLRANEAREGEGLADAPDSGAVQLMTIHAAKGLEFPVVVVVDLGREQRRMGATDRLMYDPAFGLVCMVRDRSGDWLDPASCVWARWLDGRLEAAESKRLLYVACTRAAELLLLSGQIGKDGSWLNSICTAWQTDSAGAKEQRLAQDGWQMQVYRPAYHEEAPAPPQPSQPATTPLRLAEMPALALPLPSHRPNLPVPVTQLERLLASEQEPQTDDEEDLLQVRPALDPRASQPDRVPAALVGQVVHRALADWDCLELPDVDLAQRIESYARREGIRGAEAIADALRRGGQILTNLRASALYGEICRATQRWAEVPFTLTIPSGVLHGVIDLLYEDIYGRWHLIDWKSEYVREAQLPSHAEQHTLQVAIYAEAARAALGQRPQVAVCFLNAHARVWNYRPADLDAALDATRREAPL